MLLIHLVADLPVVAIERILSYLADDWMAVCIAYPLLVALLPSSAPRLTQSTLKKSILNQFTTAKTSKVPNVHFKEIDTISMTLLIEAIEKSPNLLYLHTLDLLRFCSRKHDRHKIPLDTYYSSFNTISLHLTPRYWNRNVVNMRKRHIAKIAFHPCRPVVALVFNDSYQPSFGIYAYAGKERAEIGQCLYYYQGLLARNYPNFCRCTYTGIDNNQRYMHISWSPNGTKLACVENYHSSDGSVVFFSFDYKSSYKFRRLSNLCWERTPDIGPFRARGWHRLHNLNLWFDDSTFLTPYIKYEDKIVVTPITITIVDGKFNVSRICERRTETNLCFPERCRFFVYKDKANDHVKYCDSMGEITHGRDDYLATGFWLVKGSDKIAYLFSSEDCPDKNHYPHSIMQRYPVNCYGQFSSEHRKGNSFITFANERIHDAAVLLEDSTKLLVLLSRSGSSNPPWMSSKSEPTWDHNYHEPICPSYELPGDMFVNETCHWGTSRQPAGGSSSQKTSILIENRTFVYLGIIDAVTGIFKQLAVGKIEILNKSVHPKHQLQLQILSQTERYVIIRECCFNGGQDSGTNSAPRLFLFSKSLGQCLEIKDPNYFPHPKQNLMLWLNLGSFDPQDSQTVAVARPFAPHSSTGSSLAIERDREDAFGRRHYSNSQRQPCYMCEMKNYTEASEHCQPMNCLYVVV